MKKLTAITTALLVTASVSSAAFADNISDDFKAAQADYKALSAQLETMGYNAQSVNLDGAATTSQKLDAINAQRSELQNTFNQLNSAN